MINMGCQSIALQLKSKQEIDLALSRKQSNPIQISNFFQKIRADLVILRIVDGVNDKLLVNEH